MEGVAQWQWNWLYKMVASDQRREHRECAWQVSEHPDINPNPNSNPDHNIPSDHLMTCWQDMHGSSELREAMCMALMEMEMEP